MLRHRLPRLPRPDYARGISPTAVLLGEWQSGRSNFRTAVLITDSAIGDKQYTDLRASGPVEHAFAQRRPVAQPTHHRAAAPVGIVQRRPDGAPRQDPGAGASADAASDARPAPTAPGRECKRLDRRLRTADRRGIGKSPD